MITPLMVDSAWEGLELRQGVEEGPVMVQPLLVPELLAWKLLLAALARRIPRQIVL